MKSIADIIYQLQSEPPTKIPFIGKVQQNDRQLAMQAVRRAERNKLPAQSLIALRAIECQVKKVLKNKDYLKPLLEINFEMKSPLLYEARLRICENIIQYEQIQRVALIQFHLNALDNFQLKLSSQNQARIAIIRASRFAMLGDYLRSSTGYLECVRQQQFVNDQYKKQQLIEKSIAYAFLTPQSAQNHKIICALYLNDIAKRSKFHNLIKKLYSGQMIDTKQLAQIEAVLPNKMSQKDSEGVSPLTKALFSHNMTSLLKTFTSISFATATAFTGVSLEQLFILIQKTYQNRQILIDQQSQYLYFKEDMLVDDIAKQFLSKLDEICL